MTETLRLRFLGTGTSHGIPVIGCSCAVCRSDNPANKRYRPSVVVEWRRTSILVDTPPELRLQLLRANIREIDALLFTHTHADHIFGLDDVRVFNQRRGVAMPVYGSKASLANLRQQFFYVFVDTPLAGGKPQLDLIEIDPLDRPFMVAGLPIQPIPVWHGPTRVLGFRFGDIAYVTDTNNIPAESMALLENLDVLVLDALRMRPHPTHYSLGEALAVVARLRPKRAYFTHICHDLEHEATNQELPLGVALAFDGLNVESSWEPKSP